MGYKRVWKSGPRRGAVGLIAISTGLSARAANLLVNPGFEAPTVDGTGNPEANPNSDCSGWTFNLDCQRANYFNHTPGGAWSIWAKTFEPVGGGIVQEVNNITAGSNYDFTSQVYFQTTYPTTSATIQLGLIWLDSSNNPIGTPDTLNIDPTSNPAANVWTPESISGVAPAGAVNVYASLGWSGGGTVPGQQSAFFDDADLEGLGTPPTNSIWITQGSGDWNFSGNWANGTVPVGVGAEADFFGAITADHTVYTDVPITAGILNFNNAKTYVIGGAGSLTLQAASGNAMVIVQQGNQKINLPLIFASSTTLNVSNGATLTIGNPATIDANKTVTKTGTVLIQAPLTLQSGASLVSSAGALALFGAPTLGTGAKVDLTNTSMAVDYHGLASPAAAIRAQLVSGFHSGAWNGAGIDSSSATDGKHALGYRDDTANSLVNVKYTYYGDSDLNGTVDSADFALLAANYGATVNASWMTGDYNYDGTVNALDFNLLATNYGSSLSASVVELGAVVPEPMSAATLLLAGMLAACRRHRRNGITGIA